MKTTLTIPEDLLKAAMKASLCQTKSETVRMALEALLRQKRLDAVIAAAGTLAFSSDWNKARHER